MRNLLSCGNLNDTVQETSFLKRKVPFSTLMENMTGYYRDCRGTAKGVKGTYYFCEKCNEEALSKFQNVAFLTTYKEYAPEIKSVAVFVADRCF